MAVKIRLARAGAKKRPYYNVVVADANSPRDGRFIEKVGSYNPMLAKDHQDRVKFIEERVKHWLGNGAQPTDRVARMLGQAGIIDVKPYRETPKKSTPGKKAQERMRDAEEKAKRATEEKTAKAES